MILGFDTSNYTTSTAAVSDGMIENVRQILPVKKGLRGLRQSDALFLHIKQLPFLYTELCSRIDVSKIEAIGVSTRPRSVDGSYMPVFLAGESFAVAAAQSLNKPLFRFSHQDGHLMAGIYSSKEPSLLNKPFLCVHLSGGTTEILRSSYSPQGFHCDIIGGTLDISAGQLIDRVGVAMGLSFPSGKELDRLSGLDSVYERFPICVKDTYINFSGLETKAIRAITPDNHSRIAGGIFDAIARSLAKALETAVKNTGLCDILMVGGVASNTYLRRYLSEHIDARIHFASPELSTDNAVGIALLTKYRKEETSGTENCNRITN